MSSRLRTWLVLALLAGCFAMPSATDAQSDPPLQAAQAQILALLNQARRDHGLQPVALDSGLSAAAQKHSELMADRHEMAHQLAGEAPLITRLANEGVKLDAGAENVADTDSPQDAETEWMLSPGHRANILNPQYNSVGIGMAQAGPNRFFFTQDFAHRVATYNSSQLEQHVLDELNQIRAQHRLPSLESTNISMLEHEACREDVKAASIAKAYSDAGWAVVFSSADPNYLPDDMSKVARRDDVRGVALGACYPQSDRGSYAMYRVIAIFFRKS